jgi:hypothetical protein
MAETTAMETLRSLIQQDEQALISLKKQATDILEHIDPKGFRAASRRERVMAEAQVVEERLHENKQRLAALQQFLRSS